MGKFANKKILSILFEREREQKREKGSMEPGKGLGELRRKLGEEVGGGVGGAEEEADSPLSRNST